jgi:hypothetical protein
MTSEQLSDLVTDCIESLRSRILGVGQDQYSNGDIQAIELKSNAELIIETIEEVDDALTYLAVLRSRLITLSSNLKQ